MKSLPLSSVEEMLLNHKQLFQSQLGCVRLGNLKMLGRRRGGVPAGPRQRLRPAQNQGTQEKHHPPHQVSVGWHRHMATSPSDLAVAISEAGRARGILAKGGQPAKAAEGLGLPSPGKSSAARHQWHWRTRPEGFPSKDRQNRSSGCPPGSSPKGCDATSGDHPARWPQKPGLLGPP